MARRMKEVRASRARQDVLVVRVDPLQLGRGPRQLPRGGAHRTAKRPARARAKRELARQLAGETAGGRAA
jgi:hypothetical protein